MIELTHKTYGTVYVERDVFDSTDAFMRVTLKTPHHFPKQGTLKTLTVGKGAIKEKSKGYKPKHRPKTVVEQYLPLALSIAARMRTGYDDYDELTSIASEALIEAAAKYDSRTGVYFPVYAKTVIENKIKDHWRKEARKLEDTNDFNFDDLMVVQMKSDSDFMVAIERATLELRPRLRELVNSMYLCKHPLLAKELAYKWNVSEARVTQLKQEAIKLLRDILKK